MENFLVHLGVGLISGAFGKIEDATRAFVHCQQLALQFEYECGENVARKYLYETVHEHLRSHTAQKTCEMLTPLFTRSCRDSREGEGWASFFVGAIYSSLLHRFGEDEQRIEAIKWLAKAYNSATTDLLRYEASMLLGATHEDPKKSCEYFTMQRDAARGLNVPQFLVYALFQLGETFVIVDNFDEAFQVEKELKEVTENCGDSFCKAIAWKLSGRLALALGRYRRSIKINSYVAKHLKLLPTSWEHYYVQCANQTDIIGTPTRAEWTINSLMDVYNEMVIAHSRLEEPAYAMAAAAQFEKLITKGLHKRDEAFNRLRYLIGLTTAHLMQGWSAALPQKQKYHFEESEALAAEALFLSDQVNDRSTYINVLCSLTEVVPYYHRHNGLVKFWLTEEDREHFELVDSFLAEAEVLAIQQPHLLLKVLNLRGFLYFMIKRMDKAAEKLKMFAERFIEAYYRLGSSSIGRISYHDIWKSSFRMLQAASLKEMRPFEALIWAERERARERFTSQSYNEEGYRELCRGPDGI